MRRSLRGLIESDRSLREGHHEGFDAPRTVSTDADTAGFPADEEDCSKTRRCDGLAISTRRRRVEDPDGLGA
ncbi:hypothetical protein V8D89_013374 [Ganoderma adspersum]